VNSIALSLAMGHALSHARLSPYHSHEDELSPRAESENRSGNSSNQESKRFFLTQDLEQKSVDNRVRLLETAEQRRSLEKLSVGSTQRPGGHA